jgi:membrane protease YdiL (CAAX protease family)
MKKTTFLWVIFAIFLSELIMVMNQVNGFIIYAVLLGIVLVSIEKGKYLNENYVLLIFLMIVPTARISELFIPFGFIVKSFIFYAVIASLAVFYTRKFHINSVKTLLDEWIYGVGIVLIGFLLALDAKFFLDMQNALLIPLILFIAYTEEILFRGKIQNLTKEKYGAFYSIFFTSLLYGIFSISYGFPFFLIAFFACLILCTIYQFTKNIHLSFLMNISFHIIFFIVYPSLF